MLCFPKKIQLWGEFPSFLPWSVIIKTFAPEMCSSGLAAKISDFLRGWFLLKICWKKNKKHYYFDEKVCFHRVLWSQGRLAVKAICCPLIIFSSRQKLAQTQGFCCSLEWHLAVHTFAREKLRCIDVGMQVFPFMLTHNNKKKYAMQRSGHSQDNKIKNNSNKRNFHTNAKNYKVLFNYSNFCLNYLMGF